MTRYSIILTEKSPPHTPPYTKNQRSLDSKNRKKQLSTVKVMPRTIVESKPTNKLWTSTTEEDEENGTFILSMLAMESGLVGWK